MTMSVMSLSFRRSDRPGRRPDRMRWFRLGGADDPDDVLGLVVGVAALIAALLLRGAEIDLGTGEPYALGARFGGEPRLGVDHDIARRLGLDGEANVGAAVALRQLDLKVAERLRMEPEAQRRHPRLTERCRAPAGRATDCRWRDRADARRPDRRPREPHLPSGPARQRAPETALLAERLKGSW